MPHQTSAVAASGPTKSKKATPKWRGLQVGIPDVLFSVVEGISFRNVPKVTAIVMLESAAFRLVAQAASIDVRGIVGGEVRFVFEAHYGLLHCKVVDLSGAFWAHCRVMHT